MGRKSKVPSFKKIEAIEKYLQGKDSLNHLAKELILFRRIDTKFLLF